MLKTSGFAPKIKYTSKMVDLLTKDFQILNLKFDQVMFNNLVLKWEGNFEVMFGIFSVLVFQISGLESYIRVYSSSICGQSAQYL